MWSAQPLDNYSAKGQTAAERPIIEGAVEERGQKLTARLLSGSGRTEALPSFLFLTTPHRLLQPGTALVVAYNREQNRAKPFPTDLTFSGGSYLPNQLNKISGMLDGATCYGKENKAEEEIRCTTAQGRDFSSRVVGKPH